MRQLRRMCATLVLTLIIADATFAGDGIMFPGYIPPPPPSAQTAGAMYPGDQVSSREFNDEDTPVGEDTSVDIVTDLTLSLVRNLLALL